MECSKSIDVNCLIDFHSRMYKLRINQLRSIYALKYEIRQLLSPAQDSKINIYFADETQTIHKIKKFSDLEKPSTQDKGQIMTLNAKIVSKKHPKNLNIGQNPFIHYLSKPSNQFKDNCNICKNCQGEGIIFRAQQSECDDCFGSGHIETSNHWRFISTYLRYKIKKNFLKPVRELIKGKKNEAETIYLKMGDAKKQDCPECIAQAKECHECVGCFRAQENSCNCCCCCYCNQCDYQIQNKCNSESKNTQIGDIELRQL